MCKRNVLTILLTVAFLIVCPTLFQTRANVAAQDGDEIQGKKRSKVLAPTAVQLQTVFTGLSGPVYITHAHDGTNRLFIIEQVGRIRVAQPGASTSTVFLDITSRVLSGGERGLLGLAFHPQYSINGRFFVYYTRQTDGQLTIAEYRVSANDPNVANAASEIVFLNIPHPGQSNHNGGCTQFGPDGYLYFGTGDGGSGDDPPNNAQNINVLLGKMLRIDVDNPNGVIPYSAPSTNPFFGSTPGADEIYAYGIRNPWRWSFDRATGQLICGDVGQNNREEIDIITNGGNYGWRVMEGMICNPAFNGGVCTPPTGSILPIFEYSHTAGRCSITGGYNYRGARSTLPTAAYIYADYCTGEIWQLASSVNTLLFDTTQNITSFGEDEAGEIYAVGQGGTISRIATSPTPPACTYSLSPTSRFFSTNSTDSSVSVTAAGDCAWLAAATVNWITLATTSGAGTGNINFTVSANPNPFPRTGFIHVGGQTLTVVQDSSAAPDCVYAISSGFQSFPSTGGPGSFNVLTEARCAWGVTVSDPTWITVTAGETGVGNGTVNFTVSANATGAARKGTITVGNRIFTVKQKR